MGPDRVVATGGVWRCAPDGMSFTNEWMVGTAAKSGGGSWSFNLEHRGHLDYGNYYSGKTSGDSLHPASGRRIVYGEVQPIKTNEAGATSWMGVCGSHHTFPRELVLDDQLGLRVLPIPELASLRQSSAQAVGTSAVVVGSQVELRMSCFYTPSVALEFGFEVLRSADGREHLRVGLSNRDVATAPPGLRLFAQHVGICDGQVNGAAICNTTQVAPIPAAAIAAHHVNLTVVVDGGLIESFAAESVALTSLADPSTATAPEHRMARVFGTGVHPNAVQCAAQAWRLAL